ncbi:MAG TPA: HNH endonuclease [Acidimicrobiales bacterium]|nr:HNH endonuclease [Acidimicrobiales bacterium]
MLREETTELVDVAGTIAAAVDLALARDFAAAEAMIATIDPEVCRAEKTKAKAARKDAIEEHKRSGSPTADAEQTDDSEAPAGSRAENDWGRAEPYHLRDGYRCRYAHCNRRTVDTRVVRTLSKLIPGELPYHSYWNSKFTHPLVGVDTASLDHVAPISRGGHDTHENLVCSCACCNYAKSNMTIEELGWEVLPVPEDGAAHWDGLVSKLPKLEALVAEFSAKGELPEPSAPATARSTVPGTPVAPGDLREGDFVWFVRSDINRPYSYRVIAVGPEHLQVVMMWRDQPSQGWAEGNTAYDVDLADGDEIRLLSHDGPRAGDPI